MWLCQSLDGSNAARADVLYVALDMDVLYFIVGNLCPADIASGHKFTSTILQTGDYLKTLFILAPSEARKWFLFFLAALVVFFDQIEGAGGLYNALIVPDDVVRWDLEYSRRHPAIPGKRPRRVVGHLHRASAWPVSPCIPLRRRGAARSPRCIQPGCPPRPRSSRRQRGPWTIYSAGAWGSKQRPYILLALLCSD